MSFGNHQMLQISLLRQFFRNQFAVSGVGSVLGHLGQRKTEELVFLQDSTNQGERCVLAFTQVATCKTPLSVQAGKPVQAGLCCCRKVGGDRHHTFCPRFADEQKCVQRILGPEITANTLQPSAGEPSPVRLRWLCRPVLLGRDPLPKSLQLVCWNSCKQPDQFLFRAC